MGAPPAQQDVNWIVILLPALLTIGGGTIIGNMIVAGFKLWLDKRLAVDQRNRDCHLARADVVRKIIASLIGARLAASDARIADLSRISSTSVIADKLVIKREEYLRNFDRLSDEALIESEKYGLLPEWSGLDDHRLSSYVEFVLSGRLAHTLDANSYQYGQSRDAHHHVSALLVDLRTLVEVEVENAHRAFRRQRKITAKDARDLPYLKALKVYFPAIQISIKSLDMSVLEERLSSQDSAH